MTDLKTNYATGDALFGPRLATLRSGEKPRRYRLPPPFDALDIRPGYFALFGGAPGHGKTAALLQIAIELLRENASAVVLVANVEVSRERMEDRILARLAQVPLSKIVDAELTPEELESFEALLPTATELATRLAFLNPPYTLRHIADTAVHFGANVIILDYIQRIRIDGPTTRDRREELEDAAGIVRGLCDRGAAVLVASAVARQKNNSGNTYAGLNLASFRGSSELEYGCDAAYVFVRGEGDEITLSCEKNRHAAPTDIRTLFDRPLQQFRSAPTGLDAFGATTPAHKPRSPKGDT
ncbi:MAG: DnaB-like helicase C-terminal domain-containing protein [Gemmataceae bacterium]